uniref:Uncharacterized protein n=1 Tax=Euplotes crassus TaxID=5936 RepID=A0A7S3P1L3_EUPCR|mmetsp:Transcript_5750/g.5447  ORF Transcript_5750/g.5447 Transcript_5750/m.5447 type:complete len:176 (+) Transcript_5750:637-1164(+)
MFATGDQHNRSKSKDGDDLEDNFEEIEENIIDEIQEEIYSDTFSQVSRKSKRMTGGFKTKKNPKEMEDNPYLYFAKKAQMRMKAKCSGKKASKVSTLASKQSIISNDGLGGCKRLPTDQSDSVYGESPLKDIQMKQYSIGYRPFSPPFANMNNDPSEIEDIVDADFVPTKNIDYL